MTCHASSSYIFTQTNVLVGATRVKKTNRNP